MKGLKITLLLVLGAAFVYCDQFKNYYHGQYPLIQSRGLDVLSLKRNENLNRGSNSRNVVYPAQTYDSSQQVQTESERMNLRGNLNDAAYDDNWREESPHHWRLRGQSESRSRNVDEDIVSRGEAARRQEQRDVYTNGGDVADIERQFVHTHHWRPQQQQNSESRARGATDETRPGFVHTHVWRQEPYQEQEEREAASARVARAIRGTDASDDEVIARGEDARRQEAIAEEQSRKKTRTVPSDEQPGPMENVRVADIERQYVHTHHWRPQQQTSESRSRNVPDEDIVNQAEDARLRDSQNADIDRSRVHTHVWRQDPYQEPDSSNEQSSRSRTVRDVETEQQQAQQPGPMDHVHTHVWRQDPYQEEDSANDQQSSRSRTVRDVDAQQQSGPGPMDHVHTHVWRQDPYQGEEDQQQTRSRTVRDVDTQQQSGPGPMDHVHTHVWRQEPYQEQEAREAANDQQARSRAVRDTDTQQARPSPMDHVHTHVWRQEPYQEQEEREARLARAIRARNMRPDEQQIAEGEIYARNEGDGDEERIHHGQHVPDDISSQESDVSVQPRTESDSASSSNSQVHYHFPHGLQVEEPNVDTSAASETSEQTNNIAIN